MKRRTILRSVAAGALVLGALGLPQPAGAAKGHLAIAGQVICEIHLVSFPQKVKQTSPTTCDGAADGVGVADNGTKTDNVVEVGNVAAWQLDPAKPKLNFSAYNIWYEEPAGAAIAFANGHIQSEFTVDSGPHAGAPACLHATFEWTRAADDAAVTVPAKKPVKGGDVPQTHVHDTPCDNVHKTTEPNQVACPPSPPGPQHGAAHANFLVKHAPANAKPGTLDVTVFAEVIALAC